MKILFTTSGKDWNATLEERFGRANGFLIFDANKNTLNWVSNEDNKNASQGAGVQAAQKIVNLGAQIVVTGHLGPKAETALRNAGIKVFSGKIGASIKENFELLQNDELSEL